MLICLTIMEARMDNNVLNSLLREYEHKKIKAELDLEKRKETLYKNIPKLQEIENEINSYSINHAKNILNNINNNNFNNRIDELKSEKKRILEQNNISENYLKPHYNCRICNDTGYFLDNNYRTSMCNCLKQRILDISYNKSNMSNLKKENFLTFNENKFSDEVDIAKYKVNISPKKNMINIKQKCLNFVEDFDNPNSKNLLFTGNTGLGKTFMSNCIANELLQKGKSVLYQTAPVLLETIIDNKMSKYKTSSQDTFYKNVLEADLLIIDDLGTECLNSMKLSELFTILNTRLLNLNSKVTKTIISTNLSIDNIFKTYEERIGSRIAGYYDIYYFFGEDLRFKKNIN